MPSNQSSTTIQAYLFAHIASTRKRNQALKQLHELYHLTTPAEKNALLQSQINLIPSDNNVQLALLKGLVNCASSHKLADFCGTDPHDLLAAGSIRWQMPVLKSSKSIELHINSWLNTQFAQPQLNQLKQHLLNKPTEKPANESNAAVSEPINVQERRKLKSQFEKNLFGRRHEAIHPEIKTAFRSTRDRFTQDMLIALGQKDLENQDPKSLRKRYPLFNQKGLLDLINRIASVENKAAAYPQLNIRRFNELATAILNELKKNNIQHLNDINATQLVQQVDQRLIHLFEVNYANSGLFAHHHPHAKLLSQTELATAQRGHTLLVKNPHPVELTSVKNNKPWDQHDLELRVQQVVAKREEGKNIRPVDVGRLAHFEDREEPPKPVTGSEQATKGQVKLVTEKEPDGSDKTVYLLTQKEAAIVVLLAHDIPVKDLSQTLKNHLKPVIASYQAGLEEAREREREHPHP